MILVSGDRLIFEGQSYCCAVGKNGFTNDKKEGDGRTPVGVFPLREVWYRADRMEALKTKLPLKIITQNDGWCDDVKSRNYNKHIKLPYDFSHEKLWRDDITNPQVGFVSVENNINPQVGFVSENNCNVYDLIIPLGYNDENIVAGKGSAIFMHIAKPDYSGTEGCIALAKNDLLEILPFLSLGMNIEIKDGVS